MSQFSIIRIGRAGGPEDTTGRPALDVVYPPQGGVTEAVVQVYSVVPLVLNATNIATAQTLAAAGALALAAGTGTTFGTYKGVPAVKLDLARCVTLTGVGGTVAVSFTVSGYDVYGQAMTQTLTGPAGATTVTTTKAFFYVTSVVGAGATTNTVSAGTSDVMGLPYAITAFGHLGSINYNNAVVTASTGFVAAVTTTASATTGDVRGTYALQSASDGTKRLVAWMYIPDTSTTTTVWGPPQA